MGFWSNQEIALPLGTDTLFMHRNFLNLSKILWQTTTEIKQYFEIKEHIIAIDWLSYYRLHAIIIIDIVTTTFAVLIKTTTAVRKLNRTIQKFLGPSSSNILSFFWQTILLHIQKYKHTEIV